MRFQFYGLAIAFIVQFDPPVFLDFLADIDAVEVCQHAFVGIEASVDIEPFLIDNRSMIGSRCDVLTLDLDLSPTGIEGVLQLSLHYNI